VSEHADYSVGLTWLIRENQFFLLEMIRKRLEPYHLRKVIIAAYQRYPVHAVLIERTGAGEAVVSDLCRENMNVIAIKPQLDKKSRMMAEVAAIEAHRVLLPKEASWLADFEYEMVKFPQGRFDDIVDATSQFLCFARNRGYAPTLMQCVVTSIPSPYF
jgi:predicted phage terminase large subunit-like protein